MFKNNIYDIMYIIVNLALYQTIYNNKNGLLNCDLRLKPSNRIVSSKTKIL